MMHIVSNDGSYTPKRKRQTNHVAIRGVDYRISEWGCREDPLIVYLHGFGDTGSTFQFVVDELLQDWFVAAPDEPPFPRSKITWIEDAGHMLHFEQARQLANEIEEFLAKPAT
jgi:pimeloyl-ACP methyl ester carboxylesterase